MKAALLLALLALPALAQPSPRVVTQGGGYGQGSNPSFADAGFAGKAQFADTVHFDAGFSTSGNGVIDGDLLPASSGGIGDLGATTAVWTNVRGYYFTSSAGSGNNAYAASTNGARYDFGAGASDYASSDGTTVAFAGPITVSGRTPRIVETTNTATPFAGGGQANATVLTADSVNVGAPTSANDSVKLPASPSVGTQVVFCNSNNLNAAALYPASGGKTNIAATDALRSVAAGTCQTCRATSTTQWWCQ